MSGREETSEPIEAEAPEHGEQAFLPSSPAPPSFGHPAAPPQPVETRSPWWVTATTGTSPADTLVAGPGVSSLDTRNAVPAAADPDMPPPPWLTAGPDSPPEPGPEPKTEPKTEPAAGPGAAFAPGTGSEARAAAGPRADETVVDLPAIDLPLLSPEVAPESEGTPDTAVALLPDAILPPGTLPATPETLPPGAAVPPQTVPPSSVPTDLAQPDMGPPGGGSAGGGPFTAASAAAGPMVLAPLHHAGTDLAPFGPAGPETRPGAVPPTGGSAGGRGRVVLIAVGGAAAAVIIGTIVFVGFGHRSGPTADQTSAGSKQPVTASEQPQGAVQPPVPTVSATPKTPPTRGAVARSPIDSAKTDPRPLAMREVFPVPAMSIAGRPWKQDKASVNHDCALAARGAMATALKRQRCASVVRATYVTGDRKYAVTTGVAVLPTKADALVVSSAGDPSSYEWFRGMQGKIATEIDQAGGYASSTVRGRYVIYSYAQYVDEKPTSSSATTLRDLTRRFIDYAVRPIDRRAG